MSEIQDSLRAQGYDVDERGYDRCLDCKKHTMPGVKECYKCWKIKQDAEWKAIIALCSCH